MQVHAALKATKACDPARLCIEHGRAAWAAYLDLYILDADGALLDACLLAAASTLQALRLPTVCVTDKGNVSTPGPPLPGHQASCNQSSIGDFTFCMQTIYAYAHTLIHFLLQLLMPRDAFNSDAKQKWLAGSGSRGCRHG